MVINFIATHAPTTNVFHRCNMNGVPDLQWQNVDSFSRLYILKHIYVYIKVVDSQCHYQSIVELHYHQYIHPDLHTFPRCPLLPPSECSSG